MNTNKNVIYNDALHGLQYYMLTTKKVASPKPKPIQPFIPSIPSSTIQPSIPSIYIPKEVNDTLFWCYYILKNGMHSFDMLQYKNIVVEKQQKIALVTTLRNNKHISKKLKLDTLGNLEGNLGNDTYLTLATFFTLCAIEQIPVMYVNKKCYFMVEEDTEMKEIHVIEKKTYAKKVVYGFKTISIEQQSQIITSLYKLPSLHSNPLKSISSYTLEQLQMICNKLNIHDKNDKGKSKLKKELYDSIVQTLIDM